MAGLLITGALSARPLVPGVSAQSFGAPLDAATGKEIQAPVSSNFGIYQPYPIPRYQAKVGLDEPSIASNFSNIIVGDESFPWGSYFTAAERSMLLKNGFVVRPEGVASFGQVYAAELGSEPMGSFVTVDAVLHGLRVTVAEAVRDMERNYASPALSGQLEELAQGISTQLTNERSPALRESLTRLLAYVQTAQSLLNPSISVDSRVRSIVAEEVRRIKGGAGQAPSSVFPQRTLDYAGFAPSGPYTLDPQLENYYRARAWLSHVGFNLHGRGGAPNIDDVRTAALLALVSNGLAARDDFRQTYLNINEPLAFFNGGTDRVAPWDILSTAMRGYYGRIVEAGPGFLADDAMLTGFIEYLGAQLADQRSDESVPTFRLVEWNLSPSRDEFARIWQEQRSSLGKHGLTLMAAAGSVRASDLLGARSGFSRGSSGLSGRPSELWVQDLDNTILYTVQPLLASDRPEGYPRFMRSEAWRNRELTSALGAWADYQHDITTVQMQSIVKAGRVGDIGAGGSEGYVEPNPEAWGRVAALAGYIRNGMTEGRGDRLINRKVEEKLKDIENAAAKLMQIAAAELSGQDLTSDQLALIRSMRDRIIAYETFADKSLQGDGYVVSAGAGMLGEELGIANGHPLPIYVIVPRNDGEEGLMLTRGAIYSYYETDETEAGWLRSISGGSVTPDMRWMGTFISDGRPFAYDPSKLYGVSASLPSTTVAYTPSKSERGAVQSRARLDLESSVVSRTSGELWFTVRSPALEGTTLVVVVHDAKGSTMQRTEIGRITNGERLDVIQVDDLEKGQYFIRVEDMGGKQLASGRFLVVK